MNMKRNRIEAQSITYDDCLIINSLDPETEDREIFKLNRDYLRLTIPIVANPTINNLSDSIFYLTTYTMPSMFSAISNIELGSSNTQINIDALTSNVATLQISVSSNITAISNTYTKAYINTQLSNINGEFSFLNTNINKGLTNISALTSAATSTAQSAMIQVSGVRSSISANSSLISNLYFTAASLQEVVPTCRCLLLLT